MSSILKALKKLEHDKASYRPEELKIDADILRADNPSRFSAVRVLAASLLLLAGGSGVTYLYMKQEQAPKSANMKAPAQNTHPVSTASDIKAEQLTSIEVVPAGQPKKMGAEFQTHSQPALPARTPQAVSPPKPVQPDVMPKHANLDKPLEATNPPSTSASVKAAPTLRVNGIAFQGEGSDSVTMINGIPLSRGSVIEGVKVEEILKNMVKFSYNGEKFEIQLGQSNR